MTTKVSRLRERRQRQRRRSHRTSSGPIPAPSARRRQKLSQRRRRPTPTAPARRAVAVVAAPAPPTEVGITSDGLAAQPLRELTGITPVMEAMLHQLGHTRFFQVAHWSGDDVAAVAAALSIPVQRIHDQRWIAQARRRG